MTLLHSEINELKLDSLHQFTKNFKATERMPALFVGHGNPMNAIEDNIFTRGFESIAKELPKPNAILCISAHWETKGTFVTAMKQPETIHDFGGFPSRLYEVQYPAPGSPELALAIQQGITSTSVNLTNEWGLDHGCWTVAKFLFPKADIPVIEMSIDYSKPAAFHYQLGKELSALRRKGVIIIGSGNSIHNLRMVDWSNMDTVDSGYDWAIGVNERIRQFITEGDHQSLVNFDKLGKEFKLAIPTPEHFIPLLYTLALQEKDEVPYIFNDHLVAGSLNMMSVKLGIV
ncbi:4,5-DOPA dioxygenase extradiol [Dysgonomonas capnocytophagoides]|uniref:4,5-DOPA-extradiol-dioxygenase n=1 Tax=Dysgonomonas capnocytophagoides TaxID=45254 RepID=UPI0033407B97